MLAAFARAFDQLSSDPRLRRTLWQGVGLSLLVLAALIAVAWGLLAWTRIFEFGWLEWGVDLLGGLAALVIAWVLFPATVSAVTGLFLERVVDAVEDRHYPGLPPVRPQGVAQGVAAALRLFAAAVALNLLILPFYFVPVLGQVLFYVVNGYLVGREFFETVALRRLAPAEARALRRAFQGQVVAAGILAAFLLTVPLLNLAAPVLAAAAMTHLFHRLRTAGR